MVDRGVESYCPLNKVRKKWSDRYKMVEEPLFKSYVFVRIADAQKTEVRMVEGVVNFVYWLGKPAVVKDREILNIRKFLNEYTQVEVQEIKQLSTGDKVVITNGLMMDHEGTVLSVQNKRAEIRIESLGVKLVALIEMDKLSLKP